MGLEVQGLELMMYDAGSPAHLLEHHDVLDGQLARGADTQRLSSSWFRVQRSGFRNQGVRFMFRVQGLGLRVQG